MRIRGEESVAELCRREGLTPKLYYRWSKEFLLIWARYRLARDAGEIDAKALRSALEIGTGKAQQASIADLTGLLDTAVSPFEWTGQKALVPTTIALGEALLVGGNPPK